MHQTTFLKDTASIDERFAVWPERETVYTEAVRICRERIKGGDNYLSMNSTWAELRTKRKEHVPNDYARPMRQLIEKRAPELAAYFRRGRQPA